MRVLKTIFALVLFISSLTPWGYSLNRSAMSVPVTRLKNDLKSAPYSNRQREALMRKWFEASGCVPPDLTQEMVNRGKPPNLICKLTGETASLIVVSGHMDHVRKGMGVVDDWSGASMLPVLYRALSSRVPKHTFLFIGFTEEEKGLVGSRYYVRHMPPGEAQRIKAMVNLECLGMNPPEVWSDHASPALLSDLDQIANTLRIPLAGVNLERVGRDDAMSFRRREIPTITIHSLTQNTLNVMHTPRDTFAAVHMAYYAESYKLIVTYLAYLDHQLPQ